MTTRYCGIGGDDANSGLTWALRKLTLNGVEDTPIVAGDTCYVGPGTYRERLIADVAGGAATVITYIGDYSGDNTDGVGGVVRITGSDDDITETRTNAIYIDANYRTFQGFQVDMGTGQTVYVNTGHTNAIIDEMYFGPGSVDGLYFAAGADAATIKNSYFNFGYDTNGAAIQFVNGAGTANAVNVIDNVIINGCYYGIESNEVGGITIRNSTIMGCYYGARVATALPGGYTAVTINNCILYGLRYALSATVAGEIVENYNSISSVVTARTNVAIGGNSNTYPPLFDSRWFFETVR